MSSERKKPQYIVVLRRGGPLFQNRDGVLYLPSYRMPATCFRSRRTAERAIDTTIAYSETHNIGWERDEYRIVSVRPA